MEKEKEYVLHFYDGKVRRVTGKLSELQKLPVSRIEEAPVSFNPADVIRRDMVRISKALEALPKPFQDGTGWIPFPFKGRFFRGG